MKKFLSVLLIICLTAATCALAACAPERADRSSYDIFIIYDEEKGEVSGTSEFTFRNSTGNEISDLKFNLYGNAFREGAKFSPVSEAFRTRAYYAGQSYGGMEISGVENCGGWNVGGEDMNILTVNLLAPVYPDESVKIKISYTLKLAKVNHRTGISESAVNLGNFYPVLCAYSREGFIECPYYECGDPFLSECADYSVTVDAPESYTVAASGQQINTQTVDGRRKTKYRLQKARDFALVLSNKFQVISKAVNGVSVSYYYTSDAYAEDSLRVACESLEYFSGTFGKYEYPTLSVVQTGFCYGGMEYPALTMIAANQQKSDYIYTIVHENAHQWWYAMVGSDQLTAAWQDEGLAEYSSVMFFEKYPNYGNTRTGIVGAATRAYRAFFSVLEQLEGKVDTTMTRNLGTYSSEFEYTNITYNKGLLLFETLRGAMGDKTFTDCLAKYFKKYSGKIATPEGLIAVFAEGYANSEPIFNSFIQGKILL